MPEHLKSLAVILFLAALVFAFAKAPASPLLTHRGEFERRRNLWFGITLTIFLVHNFWLFILLAGLLLYVASSKDENKVGLVFFILMVIPPISATIPVLGTSKKIFDIDFLRLISLAVLLPAFIREISKNSWKQFSGEMPDKLLFAYLILNLGLTFVAGTMIGTGRSIFLFFIDIFLPYAIASRLTKDTDYVRAAFASYILGALVIASIGIFEFAKKWLLYASLDEALGVEWIYGSYLLRDENLRAMGTAGQAIPFGYSMAIGFCLMLGIRRYFPKKIVWFAGLALFVMAMIASLSRGPWIGALAGFLVFIFMGPHKWRNLIRLALFGIVVIPALLASPYSETILSYLPFSASNVDEGSFTYRALLFEISINAILDSPFFGAFDYIYSPAFQELKQGQGIIDIVNTYLAIGLSSGLTGLSLFVAFFFTVSRGVWRRMRAIADQNSATYDMGRALLAAITCILVTISTVSSITFIPVIYFLLAGLAVGYSKCGSPYATPQNLIPGLGK